MTKPMPTVAQISHIAPLKHNKNGCKKALAEKKVLDPMSKKKIISFCSFPINNYCDLHATTPNPHTIGLELL